MLWLTDGEVLSKGLADEEPSSLADVKIVVETLVNEDGAELWSCDALGLAETSWLRLAVTLWGARFDLLEYDSPLTVTDKEPSTDVLSEKTLGLSVCELDALAFWIEVEKS